MEQGMAEKIQGENEPLAADAAIDLHLHTHYSDGRWTPEALLDHLQAAQFALAAITDHDCFDRVPELQELARQRQLRLLVGVEMTTTWRGEMTDLLCYGFDPLHPAMVEIARDVLERQKQNTRQVCERLWQQGCQLPEAVVEEVVAQPSSCQPHRLVAQLKQRGYELADKMLLDFATADPVAVAEAAHRAGGVCLIAHPGRDDGYRPFDEALLDAFGGEVAIDGLEVTYPRHTPAQVQFYADYVRRHHWLAGVGSDSHGPEKPPIRYRADCGRDLLARLGIVVA